MFRHTASGLTARVLIYEGTTNLGDAIQTVAISRLLGGRCAGIFRDAAVPDAYSDLPFVVNGWLGRQAPETGRNCIFAGIHLGEREHDFMEWIRHSQFSVGSRDAYTQGLLTSNRIQNELIGCPTLTFSRYTGPRSGRYSIDVEPIPGTEFETSLIPADLAWPEQWDMALHRLDQLRRAEVVYSKRVHVILPCLAFGTPVVFPSRELRDIFDKSRLSVLHWLGFQYDEVVQLDVSSFAQRYMQFLSHGLNRVLEPVDQPTMPLPISASDGKASMCAPGRARAAVAHKEKASEGRPTATISPEALGNRAIAPTVSAVVLTRNGADRLGPCLESIRRTGFFDELVVCVDDDTADESIEVARRFTDRIHCLKTKRYIESVLPRMTAICSGDFVMRIDDDERISGNWDKEHFQMLVSRNGITHVWMPRRWLIPPADVLFIGSEPWFPDLQLRLFLNNPRMITWPAKIHDCMVVQGRSVVLFDKWIDHYDLVLNSRQQREQKCARYAALRPEHDLRHFYLYEGQSFAVSQCRASGFEAAVATRKLLPRPYYRPGAEIAFDSTGTAADYTLGGWSSAETWGTWTTGDEADICLPLEAPIKGYAELSAEVGAYVREKHPSLRVEILCDGAFVGEWRFETCDCVRRSIRIPSKLIAEHIRPVITFRLFRPASPAALGESDDQRLLGLGFQTLRLSAAEIPGAE